MVFTASEYERSLLALEDRISRDQLELLRLQYEAPNRTVTARQLAREMSRPYQTINLIYGRLAHQISGQLTESPRFDRGKDKDWFLVLSAGRSHPGGYQWIMYDAVAEALEAVGIVERPAPRLPEEIDWVQGDSLGTLPEGALLRITINAYERNPEARRRCISRYGTTCTICGFDFGVVYGEPLAGYIHIHHLRPLATVGKAYEIDPIEDLRPVCPNCHAVLHSKRGEPYSIDDVKLMLTRQSNVPVSPVRARP